ncbi:disease resistance protein [Striga asiatica]|uniref:Disease resistance protein n=1 Tax=Striga asiatica TaxID=4170 RepID=A0A5A7PMN9_STRAF|nr:disease resistance protein [Striga asiatica]
MIAGILDDVGRLRELDNLKLLNDIHSISPSEGLPPPGKFPPRQRILTLSATLLGWEQMSVLGLLESLEVLKLKDNALVGPCWEVVEAGFPLLHFLLIEHTDLISSRRLLYSAHVTCLTLRNCEELEALPDGLADIPRLEVMNLHRTSKMAVSSARKIQGISDLVIHQLYGCKSPPGLNLMHSKAHFVAVPNNKAFECREASIPISYQALDIQVFQQQKSERRSYQGNAMRGKTTSHENTFERLKLIIKMCKITERIEDLRRAGWRLDSYSNFCQLGHPSKHSMRATVGAHARKRDKVFEEKRTI